MSWMKKCIGSVVGWGWPVLIRDESYPRASSRTHPGVYAPRPLDQWVAKPHFILLMRIRIHDLWENADSVTRPFFWIQLWSIRSGIKSRKKFDPSWIRIHSTVFDKKYKYIYIYLERRKATGFKSIFSGKHYCFVWSHSAVAWLN